MDTETLHSFSKNVKAFPFYSWSGIVGGQAIGIYGIDFISME